MIADNHGMDGYQSTRHMVISAHGQLVTQASRHTVNSSHKKPLQCRAVRFGYFGLMSLYHSN